MFDSATNLDPRGVHEWVEMLATVDGAGEPDSALVDALSVLERLKSAAAAAQARITMALDRSQRAACTSESEHRACSRSVGAQVALARRESPYAGNRHLGVAHALCEEMPRTMGSLTRGEISEWRAHLVVRETATLSKEHRAAVDEELDGRLAQMGNRQVGAQARAAGYRLDPTSLLRRTRGAESDRRVTLRAAPDTMTLLTGFLPVAQGVAVHAALRRVADALRSQGDDRSRDQIMADTLVARCTGRADAVGTPVEIQLVMTDHALLEGGDEPARVPGYGPIPAWLGRRLVREADKAWVRRLFVSPTTRELVAMSSRRRLFPGKLRDFLVLRDEVCRTPWCDAPVRHIDHPRPHARGGSTTSDNAQGLCEGCNYVKETPGWSATAEGSSVTTRSPSAQIHVTRPPPAPRGRARPVVVEFYREPNKRPSLPAA